MHDWSGRNAFACQQAKMLAQLGYLGFAVDMYGNTQHAFTNPQAHDKALGLIYNAEAARRSFQSLENFLKEVFS